MAIGDYERAEIYLRRAINLEENRLGRDHPNVAVNYSNLARCIQDQGNYDAAIPLFEKSLETFTKYLGDEHPRVAMTMTNLGLSYRYLEEYEKAKEYLYDAIRIKAKIYDQDHPSIGISQSHLALVYQNMGEVDSAISYYDESIRVLKDMYENGHQDLARLYRMRGNVFQKNKQFDEALNSFEKGIEVLSDFKANSHYDLPTVEQCQPSSQLMFNLAEKAMTHYLMNQEETSKKELEMALKTFLLAQEVADKVREVYRTHSAKAGLSDQSYEIYQYGIEVALELYDMTQNEDYLEQAFFFSEKAKSLTLIEAVNELSARDYSGIPTKILEQEARFKIDLAFFEKKLHREKSKGENADSANLANYRDSLFAYHHRLNNLLTSLEQTYPSYYQLKYAVDPPSIKTLQKNWIEKDQAILSFMQTDSILYIFLITKDELKIEKMALDFPLKTWIEELRAGIFSYFTSSDRTEDQFLEFVSIYDEAAFNLYQKLIKPIESDLPERLVIIPEGIIGYIPFEALLTKNPEISGKFKSYPYFLKEHQISYSFSVSLLPGMYKSAKKANPNKELLGFAPEFSGDTMELAINQTTRSYPFAPLRYSQEELDRIHKILGGKVFSGKAATIDNFKELAPQYSLLHIATHAVINDENPDFSFLAFYGGIDDEVTDMLYLRDLYALELNAELAVLSACETGIGKLMQGEGMASLARGFSFAGVKSMVTSLWPVNDAKTADLMALFYDNLKNGMAKDAALQQAKLDYITANDDYLSHPFFWASFVGIGDMTPLETGGDWGDYLLLGLLVLVLAMLFLRMTQTLIFSGKGKPNSGE